MLIPPAAISILVILYGLVTTRLNEIGDVCTSDMLLCPRCHYSRCKREALKSSCLFAHLNYLFDNAVVVAFAIVMSLWSTVFMEMWQREDSVLRLQWNVTPYEYLIVPRPQYTEQTDELKFCPISGTLEPHMSKRSVTYRYALTSVCILLLLAVMVLATFAVMVYRVSVNLAMVRSVDVDVITGNTGLIASATGALMSAVFIVIFKWFYEKVALKLTELENHRTQDAFVNAYIYKSYALAFTNNYAPLFYIAFFKVLTERTKPRSALSTVSGQVFHSPRRLEDVEFDRRFGFGYLRPDGLRGRFGDAHVHDNGGKSDSEQRAASRGADLGEPVQRVSLENMDERRRAAVGEGIPARAHRRIFHYRRIHGHGLTSVGIRVNNFGDPIFAAVIQYGFVNFFVVGFPVAPLFALLNNAVELRVDASKIVKSYRRPVPNKVAGLGAWFGILQAMTYIGVVTNALVIAFTSNIMEKIVHRMSRQHGQTFLNYTLSAYDFDEFVVLLGRQGNLGGRPANLCYYRGKRNPPGHPMEYANRKEYWKELAIKMVAVLVFEHVIVTIKGFLAYAIPDVPFAVKQRVAHRENVKKKLRMRELHEEYLKRRRRKSED
ncbi:anoctamin-5-like isoform X1 [Cylas formicarius]|uniref:anoctamin-5-like isoform X1 n=1 Tax=Cylas formicarius TaxID=197179 RepID=UPI0029586AED|nr:anoctamin-5-like isoform X1 [Cylas formicarius]XP_060527046.1 anoctamin-5-like isoform X1 [Cylas formicarius]XP_060527047.1 anoctamin-5-like isoform X1 [Cylas formicarius]XP_060527048.1 anoctamin-5-like isoform X1 [Cylas formicarius]